MLHISSDKPVSAWMTVGSLIVKPGVTVTLGPHGDDCRETSECYGKELMRHGRFRVAVCSDGLQWLFQRQRRQIPSGGAAWDTLGYCTTREALIRLHRSYTGSDGHLLGHLPARFNGENC